MGHRTFAVRLPTSYTDHYLKVINFSFVQRVNPCMLTDDVIKKFLKFECNDLPDQSRIRSTSILRILNQSSLI